MTGICKFCGCTDDKPCLIRVLEEAGIRAVDGIASNTTIDVVPDLTPFRLMPCAWLLDDVCNNPACVEKAYLEARPLAERIHAEADAMEAAA